MDSERIKIITFYLPQFHNIPENDRWWGDGFTEWTNVKKAKPLFEGHRQPRVPMGDNYYNLMDDSVKIWQSEIAQEYGIYGFCYYHYWFSGKLLLEKPMEQMLANKEITIPFCICWANEAWSKSWIGKEREILIAQKYGDEAEWKAHFDYLRPFFEDERYIKKDGKPVMMIYRPDAIPRCGEMLEYWNNLAEENGLKGITFIGILKNITSFNNEVYDCFDYNLEWQPIVGREILTTSEKSIYYRIKKYGRKILSCIEHILGADLAKIGFVKKLITSGESRIVSYDEVWNAINRMKPLRTDSIPGSFVDWDNSPRFGKRATIYAGATPEKFKKYLSRQIEKTKEEYGQDMLFLFAWNEWAESGYLEPDTDNGYAYLRAVKEAGIEKQCFGDESPLSITE